MSVFDFLNLSNHIRTSVPSDFVFPINDDSFILIYQGYLLNPTTYTQHRGIHVRAAAVSNNGLLDTCIHPHFSFERTTTSDWSLNQRLRV